MDRGASERTALQAPLGSGIVSGPDTAVTVGANGDEVEELRAVIIEMTDDERLLQNELRAARTDLRAVQAEMVRERLARMLRSEVKDLAAATSGEASRSGVAHVVAEGAARIFSAGWAMVAYETEEQSVQIVHSSSVPEEIKAVWADIPLATAVPVCDVLRGDVERVELSHPREFVPWPHMVAESERARMQSIVVEPLGPPGRPDAVVAIAWPDPHELDELEHELLELLVGRTGPAFARSERGEVDAEFASILQSWLLDVGTADFEGIEVERLYEPGRDLLSVGGDWHDVVELSAGRVAIVIGDVCGHDVRAAVEMSQVRHVLATNLHVLDDAAAALRMTDEYLRRRTPHPLATALVVVVSPDGAATLTSAGHPPPIACRPGGEAYSVECGLGPPLGSGLGSYSSRSATLPTGTVLTCFTDGVVEDRAEDIDASLASLRSDIEVALGSAGAQTTQDPLGRVLATLHRRVATPWRTDDAAAIVAEIGTRPSATRPR